MKQINETEEIELFDAYKANEMSMQDRLAFENRMASDISFKKRYMLHALLVDELQKKMMKEHMKKYEQQQKTYRIRLVSYAQAACISAVFVLGGLTYYQNYTTLESQSFDSIGMQSIVLEGASPGEAISFENYIQSSDTKSLQTFVDKMRHQNDVVPRDGLSDELDWIQVMIYAKEHKIIKARKLLKKIVNSNSKYKQNAQRLLDDLWF